MRPPEASPLPPAVQRGTYGFIIRATATMLAVTCGLAACAGVKPRGEITQASPFATGQAGQTPKDCAPLPDTAEGWSDMIDNSESFIGGDGIVAVTLPDGRLFALTSDNYGFDGTVHNNSNALLSFCGADAKSLKPRQNIIPSQEKGVKYWPTAAEVITSPEGETTIVASTYRVEQYGSGPFDFRIKGVDFALFSVAPGEDPVFKTMIKTVSSDTPEVNPDGSRNILWGASLVADGQGNLISYGQVLRHRPGNVGRDVYVSRINLATQKQEYWTGKKWVSDPAKARPIIKSTKSKPGLDASWKTFRTADGRYVLSGKGGPFDNTVRAFISKASSPAGPFTESDIAQVASAGPGTPLLYLANAVPGVKLASGNTLFSMSMMPAGAFDLSCYKPLWFEADLKLSPAKTAKGETVTITIPAHCLGAVAMPDRRPFH